MWEILFQTVIWEIVVAPRAVSDSSWCPGTCMYVHYDEHVKSLSICCAS